MITRFGIDIFFLCNGKKCFDGPCTNDLCRHTNDRKYALHEDRLEDRLFKQLLDEFGGILAFVEKED